MEGVLSPLETWKLLKKASVDNKASGSVFLWLPSWKTKRTGWNHFLEIPSWMLHKAPKPTFQNDTTVKHKKTHICKKALTHQAFEMV